MSQQILKQRACKGSQAVTEAEELPAQDISPTPTKPKDDPDAPPKLELQETGSLFSTKEGMKESDLLGLRKRQTQRPRSKSYDNEYSIIGFLDRKIRIRIMSEQLSEKLCVEDSCL